MRESVAPSVEQIASLVENVLYGNSIGKAIELSDEQLEAIYSLGHLQYQQKKYEVACKTFRLFVLLNSMDRRGIKALGSSLQMLGQHKEAIEFLGMAVVMDPTDPSAAMQIAECLISQGEKKKALTLLERISFDYGRYEKYIKYTEKATALIRLLKEYENK